MKKFIVILSVILFGMISLPSYAMTIVHKDKGYIEVSTTETREVKPDTASLLLSVLTTDTSPKNAVENNNQISTDLINSLKPLLALDKSDTIQTVNFELRPNYKTDKDGQSVFDNYTVKNIIKVKTKNIEILSSIIDTAVKNNATNIDDVSFSCEDLECCKTELTQTAFVKLKCMANEAAKSINESVCGVKSMKVDVYSQSSNGMNAYRSLAKSNMTAQSASVPIESGTVKINVTVDAAFYVK